MELLVNTRTLTGKKVHTLRKQSIIPGVVYGKHMTGPMPVQFDKNSFLKVYKHAGESTTVDLTGDNKELVLIHKIDTDPVTNALIHVDFLAVQANVKVTASVAIIMEGTSPVTKEGTGRVELVKDHVMVEALPRDLPHDIKVDISGLATLQDGIFVSDLKVSDKVAILEDADQPIVAVVALDDESEEVTSGDAAGNATAAALEAEKAKK
jgi:large subunit ribosomal protein L25